MELWDEFVLKERLAKSLAATEAAKLRIDEGLAEIEGLRSETHRLFQEFSNHMAALRNAAEPSKETIQ